MKNHDITKAVLIATLLCTVTSSTEARINVSLDIGTPPPVVLAPAPPPLHRRLPIAQRPEFLYLPSLGFSVSVGIPFDIIYYGEHYYIFQNGLWYCSSAHDGPWSVIEISRVPDRIRMYRYDEIRHYRDEFDQQRHHDNRDLHNFRRDRFELRGPLHHPKRWH
jgi:hypothetical protein